MTFVTASSDNGVYATHAPFCDLIINTTNQGEVAPFVPTFPSSCPYVTSVGATEVSPGKSVSICPAFHANPTRVADPASCSMSGSRPRDQCDDGLCIRRRILKHLPPAKLPEPRRQQVPEEVRAVVRSGNIQPLGQSVPRCRSERVAHPDCPGWQPHARWRNVCIYADLRVNDRCCERRPTCGRQGTCRLD